MFATLVYLLATSTVVLSAPTALRKRGDMNSPIAQWSTVDDPEKMTTFVKDSGKKMPQLEAAPDGTLAIKHVYKEGALSGGDMLNFYTRGPKDELIDLSNAREVLLSYKIWFQDDFDWVRGGKLPGMYGGTSIDSAKSCSGGRQRDDCFSNRLMWRKEGMGELYNYFAERGQWYCDVEGPNNSKSYCADMGESVWRGAFTFEKGQWVEVSQRLRLNDADQSNGEQELFVNGESVIKLDNVKIRGQDDVKIQGIMGQSFFGGSSDDFKPSKDEVAYFTGFALAVLEEF